MYYYVGVLAAGLIPYWFLIFKIKNWRKYLSDKLAVYSLIWSILIFVFFTISKSKLITYILPIIPQLALILSLIFGKLPNKTKKIFVNIFICANLILAQAMVIYAFIVEKFNFKSIIYELALCLVLIILWEKAKLFINKLMVISIMIICMLIIITPKINAILESNKSQKRLNLAITNSAYKNSEIFCYQYYLHSLNYYQQRRVNLVGYKGELEYGLQFIKSPDKIYYEKPEFADYLKLISNPIIIVVRNDDAFKNLISDLKNRDYEFIFSEKKYSAIAVKP